MEQLIIFIILALVGSFFRGKKKEPAKGPQPKPFTATGSAPEGPTTKLKEMYRELQREMAGADAEPPSRQLPRQHQQRTVTATPAPEIASPARPTADRKERNSSANRHIERPDSSVNRHSGRLSEHSGQRQTVSAMETHNLMPKNQDDLLKGIVFSEIFGPPKSKR